MCISFVPSQGLSRIPYELTLLKYLTELSLRENDLTESSVEVLATMVSLTTLDLSHNQIVRLPASLAALKHLRHVNLRGNPLEDGALGQIKSMLPFTRIES